MWSLLKISENSGRFSLLLHTHKHQFNHSAFLISQNYLLEQIVFEVVGLGYTENNVQAILTRMGSDTTQKLLEYSIIQVVNLCVGYEINENYKFLSKL